MSETKEPHKQQQYYKWINKQQYPHHEVQTEAEKLLNKQTEQQEHSQVYDFNSKLKRQSDLKLLHFDDQKKEFGFYTLPKAVTRSSFGTQKIQYYKIYDDIRNRFIYLGNVGYQFGGVGAYGFVGAVGSRNEIMYTLMYNKTLWERLDNHYSANKDNIVFAFSLPKTKYHDFLQFGLGRQSRQNYVDFFDKAQTTTKIYSLNKPELDLPKNSNLLYLQYNLKKWFFSLSGRVGVDFANESFFKRISLRMQKQLELNDKINLKFMIEAANMWGKNILKNDYFFRNFSSWPGSRSKNFISPRIQVQIKQYPFLSSLSIYPYMYTQFWGIFNKNQLHSIDTTLEAEYGIGLQSKEHSFKLEVGLFKLSALRKEGMFGSFKFNF